MPRGPKGEKRPADANQRAVMIGKIATGEIEDMTTDDGKNAAAVALGRMGGKVPGQKCRKNNALPLPKRGQRQDGDNSVMRLTQVDSFSNMLSRVDVTRGEVAWIFSTRTCASIVEDTDAAVIRNIMMGGGARR